MIRKKARFILILIPFSVILIIILLLSYYRSREKRKVMVTTEAGIGNVCRIVEAEGETASENEVLLLSPNSAIVQRILHPPGSRIEEGEVILTLDETELGKRLDDAVDQLELLNNKLLRLKLSSKTTTIDLEHDIEVKKLRIASLKAELEDQEALLDVGGISQVKIDKTRQELVLAEKELTLSTEKHKIRLQQLDAEQQDIELQISMKEKQVADIRDQIGNMIVRAPVTGIVLEVRARTGENKQKNELLVRIAEHTRLKIKGEISEKDGDYIRNGGKVYVEVDSGKISGVIGNINPVLEDDKVHFDVFLDNPQNDRLKVNQKVRLYVVLEEKQNVLRVKKGDYFKTSRNQCNVMVGSEIYTQEIETGMVGWEYMEIVQGLDSGDVVINSHFVRSRKIKNALAAETD